MKKRLLTYALLTSPILALYGISPVYIFNLLPLQDAALLFVGLTISFFIFWLINIYLITKVQFKQKRSLYLVSFGITYLMQLPRVFIAPPSPFKSSIEQFFVYPLIMVGAINAIILIICNSLITEQEKKDAEVEIEKLKVQNLEAQKQVLMQQLNPHFLFNALSVLKSLIKEDADVAEDYSIKLSDFLRYSVESHKTELVRLSDELKFVKDYIELQKVRFENAFNFTLHIPNDKLNDKIPVFALQTLIENAFKHNYFTEKKPLNIHISYENEKIVVSNNKLLNKMAEKTETGLTNLNRRYELITGKVIEVIETEEAFCVKIPLIQTPPSV